MNIAIASQEKQTIYHRIVRWVLLGVTFLLPIFFLPWTTSIIEVNKQILLAVGAGVGLIAWLLGIIISGQISYRATLLDRGILGVLGATVIATIFSIAPWRSTFGLAGSLSESLVSILSLSILYFLILSIFDDAGKILRNTLLYSVTLALVFGLLQLSSLYLLFFDFAKSRVFNTFGSVNSLGIVAALMLPLFLKTRLLFRGIKMLDIGKLGIGVSLVILILLNWWVSWAVAFAGMFMVIGLDSIAISVMGNHGHGSRIRQFLFPMGVIILGVLLMMIDFNIPSLKKDLPVEIAPSFSFSTGVAKSVLKEKLITGYGPENFSFAFDAYGANKLANSNLSKLKFFDSISQVFNTLVHGGILGIAALLFLISAVIRTTIQYWRFVASHPAEKSDISAILASLFAACVALAIYPFNMMLMALFYIFLALAGLVLWGHGKRVFSVEDRPRFSLTASLGFIIGLVIVLSGMYFLTTRYVADAGYASALRETSAGAAAEGMLKAIGKDPRDDRYYHSLSQVMLVQLRAELEAKTPDTTKIQSLIDSATTVAQRATQIAPHEPNNWFNLGTVYQALIGLREGADKLAEQAYLAALERRPGDPGFQNSIGQMYLAKADLVRQFARSAGTNAAQFNQEADASLVKAEDAFKKAIEQSNNYGSAIYNLGAVYDRQGKVKDAIKQLEKIVSFNANQPNMLFELGLLYYRDNRKKDAIAAFQQTILVSPDYANARWYLALLFEEQKNYAAAIEQLEKILANEANKENQDVINKLATLKKGQSSPSSTGVDTHQPLR